MWDITREKNWQFKLACLVLGPIALVVWIAVYSSLFRPYFNFVQDLQEERCNITSVPRLSRRVAACGTSETIDVDVEVLGSHRLARGCLYSGRVFGPSNGPTTFESSLCHFGIYAVQDWKCAECEGIGKQCKLPNTQFCDDAVQACATVQHQVGDVLKCYVAEPNGVLAVWLDPKVGKPQQQAVIGMTFLTVGSWIAIIGSLYLVTVFFLYPVFNLFCCDAPSNKN
eukprot:c5864_g1_i1.p1 GENE.c5864_g1_i1~~c5864_g1_i1.p1  ORF type:complete len:226 (+),score=31.89 c5864_g1_i1:36-713(+)